MSFAVRPIQGMEYAAAKALWDACFPEDAAGFSAHYFARRTRPEYVLAAFDGTDMIGALHALPYPLRFGDAVKRCAMVAGVATLPAFRHRGVAGALIRAAHERLRAAGVCAAVLKPDVDFYAQFGYLPFAWHERHCVAAGELAALPAALHAPDPAELITHYAAFARDYNGMMARTERDMALALAELETYGGMALASEGAYAFFTADESGAEVSELAGADVLPLVAALAQRHGRVRFRLPEGVRPAGLPAGERMLFSMICPLDAAALIQNTPFAAADELLSGEKRQNCTLEFC